MTAPEEDAADLTVEDPIPVHLKPKTYLELINECDNFPYYHVQPDAYHEHLNLYYALKVSHLPSVELGYLLPSVAEAFRGLSDWKLDDKDRSLILVSGDDETERSKIVAITMEALRRTDHFSVLKGWRDELYPVYGPNRELLFSIERSASCLFGVVTYGCHMTAYTRSGGTLRIWVPRRAATKQTYGGMLDNTVAGGISTGESPFESIVRECSEEASLPEDFVRKNIQAAGTVSYFHIRDSRAGGETRLLQPECQFVYDLQLDTDMIPRPGDEEVESFQLKTVEEVKEDLCAGHFKPNCALVLLDFFIRHGVITAEDVGYIEMISRLHRILEFPTM